jgi:hypothetical protein
LQGPRHQADPRLCRNRLFGRLRDRQRRRQHHGSKTAGVGSIGVVMTHLDVSRAMDQAGLKVTFIFSGKHKVDGNAYAAAAGRRQGALAGLVRRAAREFCALVARNRGISVERCWRPRPNATAPARRSN